MDDTRAAKAQDTVEVTLGERTVRVPAGRLFDRYRMQTDLDEVAKDPRVAGIDFYRDRHLHRRSHDLRTDHQRREPDRPRTEGADASTGEAPQRHRGVLAELLQPLRWRPAHDVQPDQRPVHRDADVPRDIELTLGEGRLSGDLRSLSPVRNLRLDVMTSRQLALHMPTVISIG
jgi:hypothetical protein